MNRDILLFKITCLIFAFIVCVSYRTINTHTNPEIKNSSTLLTLYTVDNKPTNLMYHLDSGTVYKETKRRLSRTPKLRILYKHAHILASTTPPHGKVLGIIKRPEIKTQNPQEKYYVYIK